MSDPMDIFDLNEAKQERDHNAWARLQGLVASLSLPMVRRADGTFHKRAVEILVGGNEWRLVETMLITEDEIVFAWGANGHRVEMRFKSHCCPTWRIEPTVLTTPIEDAE